MLALLGILLILISLFFSESDIDTWADAGVMSTDRQHHHHQHRPGRLSVPPRTAMAATSRAYPLYPHPSPILTPIPTPSKHRLSAVAGSRSTVPSLLIMLFSLRSLYSLLPFLRSSPSSLSLFPFSFLVSFLSFLLTLSFSLFPSLLNRNRNRSRPLDISLTSIPRSQFRFMLFQSFVLAIVFLVRFQALRYCGTAAMILAEFSGNIAFQFLSRTSVDRDRNASSYKALRGSFFLVLGLLLLSLSWDRLECFPFSYLNHGKLGASMIISQKCVRIGPMLLPFLSGFLGCYERSLTNSPLIRHLGHTRIRLISLSLTTVLLFLPALVSFWIFEEEGGGLSMSNLSWPLANTVLFGVLLNEWYTHDKTHKDFHKEFLITFAFTVGLELVYFPELSLWGLLICGLLFWITVRQLDDAYSNYVELGMESPDSASSLIMKPIRHIMSERKSRKIALFLMINTIYMFVEFVAGFMSNSLGLISDACHMLFDCAALAIGLYASYISRLPANGRYNYGRGRFEVLSGYANAVLLVLVGALIVLESIERILDPQEVSTNSLLIVSVGGLLVNVIGLVFFHEEHHHAHGRHGSCSHSHSHNDHHHSHSHNDHHHSHATGHEHSADCHHDNHNQDCAGGQNNTTAKCHDHIESHHSHFHVPHHDHDHKGNVHEHHDHSHETHHHHNDHHLSEADTSGSINFGSSTGLHSHSYAHAHGGDCSAGIHDSTSKDHSSCKGNCSKQESTSIAHVHQHSQKHPNHHHHVDHNMEGIFLHVLADTLGSVGVVISTLLIKFKGWLIADPACSIFISVLIISSVISLLRNSAEVLLQRIPRSWERDLKQALNDVMKIKGVCGIQNLHVWSLTNTDVIGTLHLHVSTETNRISMKKLVSDILKNAGISDLTLQVECVHKS